MHPAKLHIKPKEKGRPKRRPVEALVANIILQTFKNNAKPVTIAIGGPGGTGKSSFARALAGMLNNAPVLRLDDYKTARHERQQARLYGPHPDANKMALIKSHLGKIKAGAAFNKPVYDPAIGDAGPAELFSPSRITLVEGEVATYSEFREWVDFSVFIDAHWHTQLATRLGRDISERGYTPEKAVATFLNSNLREFSEHGAESKKWCDLHLFCHDDYRLELESIAEEHYQKCRSVIHEESDQLALTGLIVPVLTPFNDDGEIDLQAFAGHIDWLAGRGIKRLLVGSIYGERPSLSISERIKLLKVVLEYFPWIVLFDVTCQSLMETKALADKAQALGTDVIVAALPSGVGPLTGEGAGAYFNQIEEAVDRPLFIMYGPDNQAVTLDNAWLLSVNHDGLIDGTGSLSPEETPGHYICGHDQSVSTAAMAGAGGLLLDMANIVPDFSLNLEQWMTNNKYEQIAKSQQYINELSLKAGKERIAWLKNELCRTINGYCPSVRLPLISIKDNKKK